MGIKITYSLAERPALANSNLVTLLNTESRGDVCGQVLVALLVTGVLGDEVEVFAADNECAVHLGRNDGAGEDPATDGDLAGEGALLVYKFAALALQSRIFRIFAPAKRFPSRRAVEMRRIPM